ncbi:MAG TPA: PilZ domain-containing protein [Spirochaetota bacterium]|nr:PilZ domain-containing protein [Spirochaetota bacterium]
MGKEKRKYKRITINEMILDKDTPLIRDTIKNISGNGCFIQTNQQFAIGSIYEMEFKLENNSKPINVSGRIVWKYNPPENLPAEQKKNLHGYGIQFTSINPEKVQQIIDAIIYFKVNKITKK